MGKFSCPLCPKEFPSEFVFRIHWQHNHRGPMPTQKVSTPKDVAEKMTEGYEANAKEDLEIANEGTILPESGPEYSLATSKEGLGELDAVKVDKFGNIIDGFHRTGESANWRREVLDWIDTPEKLELARLAINFARRKVTDQELTDRLTFLVKAGIKPDEIAKTTGIHIRKIYRHIPQNLKSEKSLKISEGMKKEVDKCKLQNVSSSINTSDTVTIPESIPASTCDLTDQTPRVRTFAEAAKEVAEKTVKVAESSFASMNAEPEPEIEESVPPGTPCCPVCKCAMDPHEYKEIKQSVAKEFGKSIQTLLFPEEVCVHGE